MMNCERIIITDIMNSKQEQKIIEILTKKYGFSDLIFGLRQFPGYFKINFKNKETGFGYALHNMCKGIIDNKLFKYVIDGLDYYLISVEDFIDQHESKFNFDFSVTLKDNNHTIYNYLKEWYNFMHPDKKLIKKEKINLQKRKKKINIKGL